MHYTPSTKGLQPCKDLFAFNRALDHVDLADLKAVLDRRTDLNPGRGRPRCPSSGLVRAYLYYKYPGLITGHKMRKLERSLSDRSEPRDQVLRLCDFGSTPSYSTCRRAFAVLDRASELVDAAVDKISDLLQDRPWVMPAEQPAKKGKAKAGCNDYVKRQRGLRISAAAFEENILKTDPAEMRRKEERAKAWFLDQWWPEGFPRCPDCTSADIRTIGNKKPSPYRCRNCRLYFSERTGTIMQDSKLSYLIWLEALRALLRVKGMPSLQIA